MINKIKQKIGEYWKKLADDYHELLNIDATSHHYVALGFSVGTFIAILPTPGINILLGVITLLIFKKLNKLSLFFAIFFWNPVIMIPIYYLSNWIGQSIFGESAKAAFKFIILNQIYNYSRRILVGLVICALFFSLLSYIIIRIAFYFKQKNKTDTRNDEKEIAHYEEILHEEILESKNLINEDVEATYDYKNIKNKRKIHNFMNKHRLNIHNQSETQSKPEKEADEK